MVMGRAYVNFGEIICPPDKKSVLEEIEKLLNEPVVITVERGRSQRYMEWNYYKITYRYR